MAIASKGQRRALKIIFLYITPIIILAILGVNLILGLISGSTPPGGGDMCVTANNYSKTFSQNIMLSGKSRLYSDPGFDATKIYNSEDNLNNIGIWNLLPNVSFPKNSNYSITVKGEVIRKVSVTQAKLAHDLKNFDNRYIIDNVRMGDNIILALDADGGLTSNSSGCNGDGQKCEIDRGKNISIYNNEMLLKSPNQEFSGIYFDGPKISMMTDYIKNLNDKQKEALFPFLDKRYIVQNFIIKQNGYLLLKLENGEDYLENYLKNSYSGFYDILIQKNSDIAIDGKTRTGQPSVQISLRNDNAPEKWVKGGKDNSPVGEYTEITNGYLTSHTNEGFNQVWVRISDPDNDYTDNLGGYELIISQNNSPANSKVSNFINKIYNEYEENLTKARDTIYGNLVKNNILRNIISLLLILYVIIFGIFFMLGFTKKTHQEFGIFIFKMTLVNIMFSEKSWSFFSSYFFNIFIDAPFTLLRKINNISDLASNIDISNKFSFIDNMLNIFVNQNTLIILFALVVSTPLGFIIAFALIYLIFEYILLVFDIVAQVFLSVIVTSLIIAISPLFLAMILFNRTKSMFDKVIGLLADGVLKMVILFIGLSILQQILIIYFGQISSIEACWGKWFSIKGLIYFYSYQVNNFPNTVTKIFQAICCFLIVSGLTKSFVDFVPSVASMLTSTYNSFFRRRADEGEGASTSPAQWGKNLLVLTGIMKDKDPMSRDIMRRKGEKNEGKISNLDQSVNRYINRRNKGE